MSKFRSNANSKRFADGLPVHPHKEDEMALKVTLADNDWRGS